VEWILNHPETGEAIPFDSTLARIKYKDEYVVMSYGQDVRERYAAIAKTREADERAQLMLEQAPLIALLWDDDFHLLDCNQEAVKIFGLSSKKELMERFFELLPEYQPSGLTSQELLLKAQSLIFKEKIEFARIDLTMNHSVTGEAIPFDITLVRIKYKDEYAVLTYGLDLRERNDAIAKMREVDERAQIMFDTAPFASFMFDKDNHVLDCNYEIVKLFGIPDKDFYLKNFSELSCEYQSDGELSSEKALKENHIALERGYHRFEWMCRRTNGEPLPTEVTLVRVTYRGEYAIAGYIRDLTEQKAAEQLTKEVTEKTSTLTAIFNSTPDMIFCKDIDLRYTECNKAMENYFNIRNEDIIGKVEASALNIPPQIAEHLIATDKKVIAEKRGSTSEELVKSFDGKMLHFEMIRSPLIQDGKVTGIVGMARDITQRKAAEEEMNRQHSLMDTVNMAAAVLLEPDISGGFNSINRSMEMVCQSMDVDRVFLWKNFYKDDDRLHYKQVCKWMRPEYNMGDDLLEYTYEEAMPVWKDLLFEGKSINGPLDTLPRYDPEISSSYTLQSILIMPLFLKGEYWGFVSFDDCHSRRFFPITDEHILRSWGLLLVGATQRAKIMLDLEHAVDEAKNASSKAMKAYAEAETASEAKSRFVANMSHEMRTPMNVIVGLTDLMLEEEDTPGKIKETLQKINTAGSTLMGLINDVLDISKVEAGKVELTPEKYDVASLLNDIITLNIIRIEEKPITFKLDIDEELPRSLFGDDLRVKQILNNLLSNAFKYTKEGTVTLGVDCRYEGRRHGDTVWVSFCISDTGIGIRDEDIDKLFTDYNQVDTKANRKIEGTGLGLSITKKFVELMGGEITVESEYGKGSTFRVRIRQGFVTDKPIGKEIVESLRDFRYSDKKKLVQEKLVRSDLSYAKVLVVDDFQTNLDVAAGMLRKYKMHVDCVTSGQEAVDRIQAGEPVYNAIFMDHMMPEMDGMEATRLIRALGTDYAKRLPVIALTANAVAGSEQMFLDNGFNAFLPKPVNVMNLDAVIQKWVRNKAKEK
ncbi:MAG: PAS domain S-box protein, partial [Treponema sp.]|nr:PAS domain S-box protein [Treponema sp.]